MNPVTREHFNFQFDYHYYEPKVYDMGTYFEGFNLRQLKRITSVLRHMATAYQWYLLMLENKKREGVEITQDEENVLSCFKKTYSYVKTINEFMRGFKNTTETRLTKHRNTYGEQYDKELHGRRWIKSDEELKATKFTHFKKGQGQFGWGETEECFQDNQTLIRWMKDSLGGFFLWGHWLEYFQTACFEDEFSTKELNEFRYEDTSKIIDGSLELVKLLNKLPYFEVK